ncbi:MAG TPA: zinc ribbon domain-containing protein [Kofleriaceae bacterium]|nr:zinc ribbon domain-containing protein [Kofleriaceae bacterium]
MPVYEYQCKACGRDFEYQQRMSDPDKTTCEACGGALDRLISRTAFALKGGGWYKDLYASPKPEAASKPEGGEAKTDTAKSDAKPAKTEAPAASAEKPAAKPSGGSGSGSSSSGSSGAGGSSSGSSSGSSGAISKAS